MSDETFHTVVVEVEGILNSRPLTPCSEDPDDLDPITPAQILAPRQYLDLPPGIFRKEDGLLRNKYRQGQYLIDLFWKRFVKEYLVLLQRRQKWIRETRDLKVGDLVLVADENLPRQRWPLARVSRVFSGRDGHVRSCELKTPTGLYQRPITKIALLEAHE